MSVIITGLTITTQQSKPVLDSAGLELLPGRITALTGPSGSGKTTLLRAVLGDLAPGLSRRDGSVDVLGTDVFALSPARLRRFRREHLAYVGQDPGAALNPTMRVGTLLAESARDASPELLHEILDRVCLPHAYLRRRPGELSGGEQRRVALARALIRRADVLLIDEPLAGLDTRLRNEIGTLLRQLAYQGDISIAVSGHSCALRELADDHTDLTSPAPPPVITTRGPQTPAPTNGKSPLLHGRQLGASVRASRTILLHDIDVTAHRGRATAIIGASGAGKTTLARVLVGLHPACSGQLHLADKPLPATAWRRSREQRRQIQLIPQNPLSTLNPCRTIEATVARPLTLHRRPGRTRQVARVTELLDEVGLPIDIAQRYPQELSGGQRQRVALARALAADPEILICDEITSALDAATAMAIMELLDRMRAARGLSLIIITHDLRLARDYCENVFVLHNGELVEAGPTFRVFTEPSHAVTAGLLRDLTTVSVHSEVLSQRIGVNHG